MRSSAGKIQLTSLDDLFGTAQAPSEPFQEIPLADLHPFKGHPFHVLDDEKMQELAESVAQHGVLVPGIVRPRAEGGYELVSGHRRKRACELAGQDTMLVCVRELDDDEAVLIMVDSNLQREKILPSEKAFAYRLKLEAMKHQGQRGNPTCATSLHKLGGEKSRDILAKQTGESHEQIRKYIRLTYEKNLQPNFSFTPGHGAVLQHGAHGRFRNGSRQRGVLRYRGKPRRICTAGCSE